MEFYTVEKINEWYFKIKLPLADRKRCKYNQSTLKYIYSIKRYVKSTEVAYLYDEELSNGEFIFQVGYASFIYNEFNNELTNDSKELLESMIYSGLELKTFSNLRDYQNQDLQQLTIYRRGLFQTYTSYGKSEVIVTLAKYLSQFMKVVIVTPSGASLDELSYRFYKLYGIEFEYFNPDSEINLINLNGFIRSNQYNPKDEFWSNDMCIIADEVEHCCSDTAMTFYESIPNIKYMYGFSATSDKKNADPIYSRVSDEILNEIKNSIKVNPFKPEASIIEMNQRVSEELMNVRDILGRNKFLVGYYGNSIVFKRPEDFNVTLVDVVTTISKDDITIPVEYNYSEIIYNLFTEDRICRLLEGMAYRIGLVFIPMFRLQIIDFWIDNYFQKKDYIILVISGRGYELYSSGKLLESITLDQVKMLVKENAIDLILGTKSSYNALDLPELNKSILLYSKAANVVLQVIGRTARGKKLEIYNIAPIKPIPTYSKDLIERKSLIKNYYKDCNIIEIKKSENLYVTEY